MIYGVMCHMAEGRWAEQSRFPSLPVWLLNLQSTTTNGIKMVSASTTGGEVVAAHSRMSRKTQEDMDWGIDDAMEKFMRDEGTITVKDHVLEDGRLDWIGRSVLLLPLLLLLDDV